MESDVKLSMARPRPSLTASSQKHRPSVKCSRHNGRPREKLDTSSPALNFSTVRGDLFSCPDTASLAHCVSADMRMGKGIAVEFKERYGHVDELKKQGKKLRVKI